MHMTTQPRIAYDDLGEKEPAVVFLPGWCSGRGVCRDLLPLMAKTRRSLALDWRGHGESERPTGDYDSDALVQDAISVLDQAGVGTVVPIGLSHAGWVAIELRRQLGAERVPGIVLCDWMVLGPPPPFLGALAGLQDPEHWHEVREALFGMWTTGVDLPDLDDQIAEMREYGFDTWARAGREISAQFSREGSPLDALSRMETPCPTLHVYAQPTDPEFLDAQLGFSRQNPWFEVQRLDAKSHFPMYERPDDMIEAIDTFATRLAT